MAGCGVTPNVWAVCVLGALFLAYLGMWLNICACGRRADREAWLDELWNDNPKETQ